MVEDEQEARRRLKDEMVLDRGEPMPVTAPNVPYVKYIIEDLYKPSDLPIDLTSVAYDKEKALSILDPVQTRWLRMQLMRAVIMFRNSRPALAGNYNEEIKLSVLPAKHMIKLARSSHGGFERRQQTTQTVIRRAEVAGGGEQPPGGGGRRLWVFGRKKVRPEG